MIPDIERGLGVGVTPKANRTMPYTVKKLAAMSGVSVRTLHHYDAIGLLKPAYIGDNGYRFYEEPQLLRLQQILFYRTLGFELKEIHRIVGRPGFDTVTALKNHRKVLRQKLADTRKLIRTIDQTLRHLRGTQPMKTQDMFAGFDPKEQARHEKYLIDRFGGGMKKSIAESKRKVKHWTKTDWEKSGQAFAAICGDLTRLLVQEVSAESPEAQDVIRRHFEWLTQFWTPNRDSYAGHSRLIVDSELRKAYEAHHPRLAEFAAAAIKHFADHELA